MSPRSAGMEVGPECTAPRWTHPRPSSRSMSSSQDGKMYMQECAHRKPDMIQTSGSNSGKVRLGDPSIPVLRERGRGGGLALQLPCALI
jgi:hypothetical protein